VTIGVAGSRGRLEGSSLISAIAVAGAAASLGVTYLTGKALTAHGASDLRDRPVGRPNDSAEQAREVR